MGELMAGKVALVSGSTRGIGRSIAEHLAAQGARVVVTGRTAEKGEKVVTRIREAGGAAEFLHLDVTDEDSVRQAIAGFKGFGACGAAKAGVSSLTRTLAVEGAAVGIRANTVLVGRVVSGRGDSGHHTGGGRLTRIGNPMDIAYAVGYLASDQAAFAPGAELVADGGFSVNGAAVTDAEAAAESSGSAG